MEEYIVSARKYRPATFDSVVGQSALTTTLKNAVKSGKLAHAYLFCGPRGVGKTTCARIFAKAINCMHPTADGEACNECESCRAFNEQRSYNIFELDAASNNSVENIKSLMDQTRIPPQVGRYKVFIIDEVHMLSTSAFNALLKTMEEPPEHVIFILATTEVQKVPATILSRCQRYDFQRITASDIAGRLLYVAGEEKIDLDPGAAELIGRLADGAMRDALSILDTCAGVSNTVDEALVRRMAGVTDRQYLFEISDAIARGDSVTALQEIAQLRQQSVDMRRLCMELAGHYRNLMLCALPGGEKLLTGTSPEEEAAYTARKDFPQRDAVRAINAFGSALEKMARGTDQRIELELAVFSLTQPETVTVQQAVPAVVSAAAQPFAAAQPTQTYTVPPVVQQSAAPSGQNYPVPPVVQPSSVPPVQTQAAANTEEGEPAFLQPELPPLEPQPQQAAAQPAPAPKKSRPRPTEPAGPIQPFPQWSAVLELMAESDPLLISFLQGTRAYFDGRRVLFECSDAFRDYIRKNKDVSKQIKELIYQVTHQSYSIGPYEKPQEKDDGQPVVSVDDTIKQMQAMGVDVQIEEK